MPVSRESIETARRKVDAAMTNVQFQAAVLAQLSRDNQPFDDAMLVLSTMEMDLLDRLDRFERLIGMTG
jgi:hypothetical protein